MLFVRTGLSAFSFIAAALVFAGPAHAEETLTLQIHPYIAATEIVERFTPLADYLSKKTGKSIRISISKDYDEHIEVVGKDKADVAYIGPASYVEMVEKYGKKPILARQAIRGSPTFKGAIVVPRDSPVREMADLKGLRFAFGDPNSTMSHIVPRYMLYKAGVDVKDLAGYAFIQNHHNVALGVLSGDFDAGALKDDVFEEYEKRGLRALAWSPAVSEHLFVTRSTLPEKTVSALRDALLALKDDPEGREIMKKIHPGMTAMTGARDRDYDNLRDVMRTLRKIGVEP